MARKSRKINENENNKQQSLLYSTALYCRLSVEELETTNNDSLQNQINIGTAFLNKKSDLLLFKIYKDNGFTGTNFNRPGFEEMMKDIINKNINCVVVKDFSRLGRNYIETGYLIINTFKDLNIRFISINDNYDSLTATSTDDTMLAFKNMINNFYVNDLSKKIKSSFEVKRSRGEFLTVAPYGYVRSSVEKNKLIIDEDVAPYIVEIFEMRAKGKGFTEIRRYLTKTNFKPKKSKYWNENSIRRIVSNEVYIGNLLYNQRTKLNSKVIDNPKDEWIRIENTHEPIVSKELFEKVQAIKIKNYRKKGVNNNEEIPLFKGIIRCADCNNLLKYSFNVEKNFTYFCKFGITNKNLEGCDYKKISEIELKNIIYETIKQYIDLVFSYQSKISLLSNSKEISNFKNRITKKKNKINNTLLTINNKKITLYEKYFDGNIKENIYLQKKAEIDIEEQTLMNLIKEIEFEKTSKLQDFEVKNKWIDNLLFYKDTAELNREIIESLIDTIYIYRGNTLKIVWKFQDEFETIEELLNDK